MWTSRQNLEPMVLKALMHAFNQMPQVGWIRGDTAANEQVLEQSNKALQENAALRAELLMLKSVPSAKFSNLADLDDIVRINYRTKYINPRGRDTYTKRTADLKLLDIFLRVAAALSTSKTDLTISIAVKDVIKDSGGERPSDVADMDLAMLKVQFVALGLISAQIGTSVSNTVHEYLSLTPKGRQVFMEAVVVRKSPAHRWGTQHLRQQPAAGTKRT